MKLTKHKISKIIIVLVTVLAVLVCPMQGTIKMNILQMYLYQVQCIG